MTTLRAGSASDAGMVRTVNQDSSLVAGPLFAVADGMGGHAAGEVASQVAVDALRTNAEASAEGLLHAVRVANRAVWDRAADDPAMRGMGTTLCAIVLAPAGGTGAGAGAEGTGTGVGAGGEDTIVVANVGDSRVYLFHDGELDQITEDHSLVEDLVREGKLTHDEARTHPQRNVVTRVLGIDEDVDVDSWQITPYSGDRLLLCSDGLFNEVDEGVIAGVLRRLEDPDDAAAELVRLANEGGGRDNITVVVVDVVDDGGRSEKASAAIGAAVATDRATRTTTPTATPGEADADGGGRTPPPPVRESWARAELEPLPTGDGAPVRAADRPRRVTWRVVAFLAALAVVVGTAIGAIAWFARSAFFVGVDGDDVAIFKGRPGGVLWFQPTLEEETDLALDDVPPARVSDVEAGKQETTLAGARRYVARLEDQAAATAAPTTTTTTSTPTTTTTSDPATGDPASGTTSTAP